MMGRCGFCMFPSCLGSWACFFLQARQLPATFQRCAHCKIGSSKLLAGLTCPDSGGKSVYRKWLDGLSLPLLLLSTVELFKLFTSQSQQNIDPPLRANGSSALVSCLLAFRFPAVCAAAAAAP